MISIDDRSILLVFFSAKINPLYNFRWLLCDYFGAGKRPGFNHAHNFEALLPARI